MAFRNVIIRNPAKLSVTNNRLLIKQEDEREIPLEDIMSIIVENQQVTLTAKLFDQLAYSNTLLFFCDEKHLPTGVFLPFQGHSRQLLMFNMQMDLTMPFKKRIWQSVIKQKIKNQSECLKLLNLAGFKEIHEIISQVESGDPTNREAVAAKKYFKLIFGNDFKRRQEDSLNYALNYGYSIIRGALARSFVMYGFMPAVGIHHASELNNFNLADDFLEVYRPLVDMHVYKNIDCTKEITKEERLKLIELLSIDVLMDKKRYTVADSIDLIVKSFSSTLKNKDYKKLQFP